MLNGTCFISPHSDDTCIAGALTIQAEVLPRPYSMVTVFSKSRYIDASFNLKTKSKEIISQLRCEEDKAFCQALNIQPYFLDNSDCDLRKNAVDFLPEITLDADLLQILIIQLKDLLQEIKPKVVVMQYPFGPKQHIDHRLTLKAIEIIQRDLNYDLLFFDDLPYSFVNETQIAVKNTIDLTKENYTLKRKLMNIYNSQMCSYFYDSISMLPHERLLEKIK